MIGQLSPGPTHVLEAAQQSFGVVMTMARKAQGSHSRSHCLGLAASSSAQPSHRACVPRGGSVVALVQRLPSWIVLAALQTLQSHRSASTVAMGTPPAYQEDSHQRHPCE
jgi:hypothetical protein